MSAIDRRTFFASIAALAMRPKALPISEQPSVWRNYSATYSAVDKADLIARTRKAMRETVFREPIWGVDEQIVGIKYWMTK